MPSPRPKSLSERLCEPAAKALLREANGRVAVALVLTDEGVLGMSHSLRNPLDYVILPALLRDLAAEIERGNPTSINAEPFDPITGRRGSS